jgi:hypothetical protein
VLPSCIIFQVQVASEDTVLFTAQQFSDRLDCEDARTSARLALAQLIRCQHLSTYWLSAVHVAREPDRLLFCSLKQELGLLLGMRLADRQYIPTPTDIRSQLQGAPASWGLPERDLRSLNRVTLSAFFSISRIQARVQLCADRKTEQCSIRLKTPPLGGVSFVLMQFCNWSTDANGVTVGLSVGRENLVVACHAVVITRLYVERLLISAHSGAMLASAMITIVILGLAL